MKTTEVYKATTLDRELEPREQEKVFSRSALRNNIIWTEKVVFMYMCVFDYVCTCICVIILKKKGQDTEREQRRYA